MTTEDKKLAEEILFNPSDYRTWHDRFNIQCISCRDALRAMEDYHQAKLNEVTDEDIETEAGLRFENVLKPTIAKHKFEAFIIGAKAFRDGKIKKR